MRALFILYLLFIFQQVSYAQRLHFKKIYLKSIDSIETSQNGLRSTFSYPITLAHDYFPGRSKYKLSEPLIYQKNIGHLQLTTSYFFSVPDSILRVIEYWWSDTSSPSKYGKELITRNKRNISKYFKKKGFSKVDKRNSLTVWKRKHLYVQQLFARNNPSRVRVIISWE